MRAVVMNFSSALAIFLLVAQSAQSAGAHSEVKLLQTPISVKANRKLHRKFDKQQPTIESFNDISWPSAVSRPANSSSDLDNIATTSAIHSVAAKYNVSAIVDAPCGKQIPNDELSGLPPALLLKMLN